jgi:glucose-1-phosphate adenylyltransferase
VMHAVEIGEGAVVRNAIVDKNVQIVDGARVGVDLERDRERFVVSADGVVVIGKGQKVEA